MARHRTSASTLLCCGDTWTESRAAGARIDNVPRRPETLHALDRLLAELVHPIERRFGRVEVTYGFAGADLVRAVRARARRLGRFPNVDPRKDQHAGHELGPRGGRICRRDGIAVDLRVPGVSSHDVVRWVYANLPFDRIYVYGPDRPFHLSWAPEPVGHVVRMRPLQGGRSIPAIVARRSRDAAIGSLA